MPPFPDNLSSSGASVLCRPVLAHGTITPPPVWLDLHMPDIPGMTSDILSSRLQIFHDHPCIMTRGAESLTMDQPFTVPLRMMFSSHYSPSHTTVTRSFRVLPSCHFSVSSHLSSVLH